MKSLLIGIGLLVCIVFGCFFRDILQGDPIPTFSVGQAIAGAGLTVLIGAVSFILVCGAVLVTLRVINPPRREKNKIRISDLLSMEEEDETA